MRAADALVLACGVASGIAGAAVPKHRNLTAGGELRPGVYGRIEPGATPPPIIFKQPMVGAHMLVAAGTKPVYLYVPPGQVRQWERHCAKWKACDVPVLFVRVDDSPSRLGKWKQLKDAAYAAR